MSLKTIAGKAVAAGIAVFALTAAVGGIGIYSANRLSHEIGTGQVTLELTQAQMTADMMHDALRGDVYAALMAADAADPAQQRAIAADLKDHSDTFQAQVRTMEASVTAPELKSAIRDIKAPLAQYLAQATTLVADAGTDPARAHAELPTFINRFKVLESAMENLSERIEATNDRAAEQAKAAGVQAQMLMGALLVLSTLLSGLFIWMTRRAVTTPLTAITRAMERLAGGDGEATAPGEHRKDEIGAMARTFQVFRQNLLDKARAERDADGQRSAAESERARNEAQQRRIEAEQREVVEGLAQGLEKLSSGDLTYRLETPFAGDYEKLRADFNAAMTRLQQAMQAVSTSADSILTGSQEIAQASDDLSRRTEQQAASLEETAAALDQITATVRKTAQGARTANDVVSTAKADAELSGDIVNEAVLAMGGIEKSSGQISQIIGVIDEIAFQTNLLALNAGVEAARAGDAGRGFAVVAQEVRALAQRSAEAAKEIKTLIATSSSQVATGVTLVGQTGQALQRIVKQVAEIDAVVAEIAASAQEQALGLAEVNTAVNQMDQVTQQNAAMVEQATAASHSLKTETSELNEAVGKFRLGASSGPARRPAPVPAAPRGAPALQQRAQQFARTVGNTALKPDPDEGWEEF